VLTFCHQFPVNRSVNTQQPCQTAANTLTSRFFAIEMSKRKIRDFSGIMPNTVFGIPPRQFWQSAIADRESAWDSLKRGEKEVAKHKQTACRTDKPIEISLRTWQQ